MCIIIDTNTLPSVFDNSTTNHKDFKPVFDWIYSGKGKIVFGGTKYLSEVKENYLKLFVQFRTIGKATYIDSSKVDAETLFATNTLKHANFDDQHIVGLLRASGCKVICSLDARAYPFFRHNLFFSPAKKKPKIYKSLKNKDLLVDGNIASICNPCAALNKKQKLKLPMLKKK